MLCIKMDSRTMRSQTSKVIIVTGGNTGLGRQSVEALYRKNAHVILGSRSIKRGEEAKESILKEVGNTDGLIEVMHLDLSDFANVRKFAKDFRAKKLPLHVLMLNAGLAGPFSITKDGIESIFAVNHVAHHLLTKELLDVLKSSAPSRVVCVSSDAHRDAPPHGVGVTLETINNETAFSTLPAYGQSKLANILFTQELAKRLQGSGVYVNALHPGFVETEILRNTYEHKLLPDFVLSILPYFVRIMAYNVKRGALTQLYVATSPVIEEKKISGAYFVPIAFLETRYMHPKVHDVTLQEDLWKFTENLIAKK